MKKMLTTMVIAGMALTTTAQAAVPVIGAIASGQDALVARDGRLLPATANMKLIAGDKVITRSGGSAKVALKGNCNVAVGASSMLAVSDAACGTPVSFDQGRAGYAGASSAAIQGAALALVVVAGAAGIAGVVAAADGGNSAPTSPTSP